MTVDNSTLPSLEPWKYGVDYWTSFELYPDWTGKSLYVFKGMAYHQKDYWTGTMVAVKTFRHMTGLTNDWLPYKRSCYEARKMANDFNKYLNSISSTYQIQFLKPIDAIMDSISDVMKVTRFVMRFDKKFEKDEVVLFEDLLEGDFKPFVTAHGETTVNGADVLDAFCHFTYQNSEGKYVICNLKGVEDEYKFKLSNPTIHSWEGGYGSKDKMDIGIRDFFQNHQCNAICEHFTKPEQIDENHTHLKPSAPLYSACDESSTSESDSSETTRLLHAECKEASCRPKFQLPVYTPRDQNSPPPYSPE